MNRDSANVADSSGNAERPLVKAAWDQFERIAAGAERVQPGIPRSRHVEVEDPPRRNPPWRGESPAATFFVAGYRILGEIHRGGQGVVYLAIQESTRRKVAIKVLKGGPFADRIELARFEREVDVLSRLKHPHIVTIHDRGLTAGHAYYVMDYVAGRHIDAYVAGAELSVDDTLGLFIKVCDVVNVAHLRGVIHRDLKPGNILVVEEEPPSTSSRDLKRSDTKRLASRPPDESRLNVAEPKILDFGLARVAEDSSSIRNLTVTGQFVGSLPWASPEQATGRSDLVDVRSDVYSLGVILYQLLLGRFPYPVTGRIDYVVRHIVETSPAPPSTLHRRMDRDVELILLKCLAKEPERRYQSAGELAADIRHYLAHEPVLATSPSAGYRLSKFVRRNRGLVLAGAAGAAVLVLGIIGTTLGLVWAVREQHRTEAQRVIAHQSAADAQQEAERADREAQQASAVNDFMRDVLTSVEPENQGADVRLIQVLASASDKASQRFRGNPQQEAQVRDLLARVYFRLSLMPEAQANYEAALALWRQHAGNDDPRALRAEVDCATMPLILSQEREAERRLAELVPRLERILGPDDPGTLLARRNLAQVLVQLTRFDEAEAVLRELRGHPKLADDDAMQVRIVRSLIAASQGRRNEWTEASPDGVAEPADPSAALEYEEALGRELIERCVRHYGSEAAITLEEQINVSWNIAERGEYRQAIDLCRSVLESTSGRMRECHGVRAHAMLVLADILSRQGEADEPAELYLRRIQCLRQYLQPGNPGLLCDIRDSMACLDRAGRAAEGEALAREMAAALRKGKASHGGTLLFESELYVARFVSMQDRLDEAEPLLDDLVAHDDMQDHTLRARLHLFYGSHLTRRKRFEEAETELQKAVEWTGDVRKGTWQKYRDDIILGFIELYEAWGKPDQVEEYQRLREEVTSSRTRPETE